MNIISAWPRSRFIAIANQNHHRAIAISFRLQLNTEVYATAKLSLLSLPVYTVIAGNGNMVTKKQNQACELVDPYYD